MRINFNRIFRPTLHLMDVKITANCKMSIIQTAEYIDHSRLAYKQLVANHLRNGYKCPPLSIDVFSKNTFKRITDLPIDWYIDNWYKTYLY